MRPLLRSLALAYLAFGSTFVLGTAPFVLLRGGAVTNRLLNLMIVAVMFGALFCVGLLIVHVPVLGALRLALGARLTALRAAIVAALLVPGPFAIYLIVFSDANEDPRTVGEWLAFWLRVPGELLIGLLPFLAGSVAFARALVARGPRGESA